MELNEAQVRELRTREGRVSDCEDELEHLKKETKEARENYDQAVTEIRKYVRNICDPQLFPLLDGPVEIVNKETGEVVTVTRT